MKELLNKIHFNSPLVFLLVLFSILNFGNYSFLNYGLNGGSTIIPGLSTLKYLRIVFVIIPVIIFVLNRDNFKLLFYVLIKNYDILMLLFIIGLKIKFDTSAVYPVWLILSYLSFLIIFIYFYLSSNNIWLYLEKLAIFIFVCSIIAIPFTFLSIGKLLNGTDIYFSSKNAYAYFNLISIVSVLFYYSIKNKNLNLWASIFIGLNILILLLSGRRSALVTSILCLLIYLLFSSISVKKYLVTIGLAFLVVLNFSFFSDNFFSVQRFEKIDFEDDELDGSYRERLELRNFYLKAVAETNYLGLGFSEKKSSETGILSTHNTFLSSYVFLGFFGLLFYVMIIFRSAFLILITNNRKIIISYSILFLPILAINWVETNFLPGQIFFIYTLSVLTSTRFLNYSYDR